MNKRELGEAYEEAVCLYLRKKGIRITERNFRCRQGEVDLIGRDGDFLVFLKLNTEKTRRWVIRKKRLDTQNKRKYARWRIIIFTKKDWGEAFRYGLTWLQYVEKA